MITDDVDNRAVCTSGVMQVRQPVRHSWPEMQQSGRRLTGASSGIGREMAVALADKGAVLVLAARRRELLDEVADGIEASGHRRPIVIDTDLSLAGAADALGNRALDAMGGTIDVVINNA